MKWIETCLYYIEGRYGIDALTPSLTIVGIGLLAIYELYPTQWLMTIGLFSMVYGLLRPLSKNHLLRTKELVLYQRIIDALRFKNNANAQTKQSIVVRCPICAQRLRVPVSHKAISVRCARCQHRFTVR